MGKTAAERQREYRERHRAKRVSVEDRLAALEGLLKAHEGRLRVLEDGPAVPVAPPTIPSAGTLSELRARIAAVGDRSVSGMSATRCICPGVHGALGRPHQVGCPERVPDHPPLPDLRAKIAEVGTRGRFMTCQCDGSSVTGPGGHRPDCPHAPPIPTGYGDYESA